MLDDAGSDLVNTSRHQDFVDLKGTTWYLASDASAYVTGRNLVVDDRFVMWE